MYAGTNASETIPSKAQQLVHCNLCLKNSFDSLSTYSRITTMQLSPRSLTEPLHTVVFIHRQYEILHPEYISDFQ